MCSQSFKAGVSYAAMVEQRHFVLDRPLDVCPKGFAEIIFGMGCFWGAEKQFWSLEGIFSTAVGYAGGQADSPSYHDVCSGSTGHAEVVRVCYDPNFVSLESLLKVFWEGHDPTQGMRQGADMGSQYRSVIFSGSEADLEIAKRSRDAYQAVLSANNYGPITTEISIVERFHFAESYHQQYLAKNPGGYCGHGGTGVTCPVGVSPKLRP